MSLILKGIDMPKGTDGLSITFHSQDGVTETHILDATQAVQIPKGHGDIKDSKEILARAEQEVDGLVMSAEHLPMVIEWILNKSDTFLEAEE